MIRLTFAVFACALTLNGCHPAEPEVIIEYVEKRPTLEERNQMAQNTCEAQYSAEHQNYLAAIESVIAKSSATPSIRRAPLDAFRAEINAAYNAFVSRCKTHTNCLEYHGYNEAACYMSASGRDQAEQRFAALAEELREIERDYDVKIARSRRSKDTNVTVETNVSQSNEQNTDAQTGDRIEDQDVAIVCGNAQGLLKKRCRDQCRSNGC